MKRILMAAAAVSTSAALWAIPAKPGVLTVTEPDGSEVKVKLFGDERHHYYTNEDGYLLAQEGGIFYYADADAEGNLKRSEFRLSAPATRSGELDAYLAGIDRNAIPAKMTAAAKRSDAFKRVAPASAESGALRGPGLFNDKYPVFGKQKGLVILVEFNNVPFTLENPHDYFDRMLHEPGFSDYGGTGCAHDYFLENSCGQFDPEFDVYGPVTLTKSRYFYGGNDAEGGDKNAAQMVIDACQALNNEVDFSQYDCDNDGFIDNVFIFYAGQGEASGGSDECIWPHAWFVYEGAGRTIKLDGKYLNRYACSNEWEGVAPKGRPDGVGTFIHEFSHVMGLPDLYATKYTGAYTPGEWSVMDVGPYNNDGCTPPLYSAFERYALGWLEPYDMRIEASATLKPIGTTNTAGIFKTFGENGNQNDNEFYLVENRQQTSWDKYIPYHGMLIWHVDYNSSVWTGNRVNNDPDHQYVDLIEASTGSLIKSRTYEPFPGKKRVTKFTDTSKPSALSWAGVESACPITNIAESSDGIITFDINGGAEAPEAPVALPASQVSETGFTANWEALPDKDYWVSVYTHDDNGNAVYAEGLEQRAVGNTGSVAVTGINPEADYFYTVFTGNVWQKSLPSNVITARIGNNNSSVGTLTSIGAVACTLRNGLMEVTGLKEGQSVSVFDITGKEVAAATAAADGIAALQVPAKGIYIVKTPTAVLKIR